MKAKKGSEKFLQLLTDTGRRVVKQIGWLFLISGSLYIFGNYYLKPKCDDISKTSFECSLFPLIGDLGENIFQATILIWFFDIGLKRETLKEIKEIFQSEQPTRHLKGFYLKRHEYNRLIEDNFKAATLRGQKIKILCLFEEEINLFQQQQLKDIRDKVIAGCEIKILMLHPESSLLECLVEVGSTDKIKHQNILRAFSSKLEDLVKDLEKHRVRKDQRILGSIEVKFHKNLFSPIGYYSDSKDFSIAWMYFSDSDDGSEYPAFHLGNKDIITATENHFEHLWSIATGDEALLIRVTQNSNTNNIKKIFPNLPANQANIKI